MCTGAEGFAAMAVISLFTGAATASAQHNAAQEEQQWNEYNAEQSQQDNEAVARIEAQRVRRAARSQAASAAADLAASGVALDSGMAIAIDEDIYDRMYSDVGQLMTNKEISNRRIADQAAANASSIRGQLNAGLVQTAGNTLQKVGSAYMAGSKWQTSQNAMGLSGAATPQPLVGIDGGRMSAGFSFNGKRND